jgi:glycosyltransferase involved in cell wall biosynthesis
MRVNQQTSVRDPKVTILIAAFNRLALLKEAVASALRQNYDDFDVLVVDDGSGAETRLWLDKEANRQNQLKVIHAEKKGVAAARQIGLLAARGEYVCILDSDDILDPHALKRIMAVFKRKAKVDLVYTNNRHVSPDGNLRFYPYPRFQDAESMINATLIRPRVPFKHSGTTFPRQLALDLGGYDRDLPVKIDVDLFLRFLSLGQRVYLLPDAVVDFRLHRESISARRLLGIRVWWQLIDRYGPESRILRLVYKTLRSISELGKLFYLPLMKR